MITIKMRGEKWRVLIGGEKGEEWEFPDLESLENNLHIILALKNKYGKLGTWIGYK